MHLRRVPLLIAFFSQILLQQLLSPEGFSQVGLSDVLCVVGPWVDPSVGLLVGLWEGRVGGVGGNVGLLVGNFVGL